jgi:hypothetical protein
MLLNAVAQIEGSATQLAERLRNSTSSLPQSTQHASLLTVAGPCGFLVSAVLYRASVIHLFVKMVRKVDEASNFVFVQLIGQEPGIYDKCHPVCARQDKIDLAWERISHETKEFGSRLSSLETT